MTCTPNPDRLQDMPEFLDLRRWEDICMQNISMHIFICKICACEEKHIFCPICRQFKQAAACHGASNASDSRWLSVVDHQMSSYDVVRPEIRTHAH